MTPDCGSYDRQIQAQIGQYADVQDMHAAAPAADWLNGRFLAGRLREVFGTDSIPAILATSIANAVERCGIPEVVSLGSGYGASEIEIVKWACDHGLAPFRITCLELSPLLVERSRETIRAEGLEHLLRVEVVDLNRPLPINAPVAGFIALQSLHHLVELELLFEQISHWLDPEGVFVALDMIGRNGHMRWPETLAVVRQIWPHLPDRLKWDRMFQKADRWYENWDCSVEGFEGIRAQDILPQLLHAGFRFEQFFANGGLTDVFYDRRFGRNFDLDNPLDVRFLEQMQAVEDRLIATGQIKPVCMYAVMRSPRSMTCPARPVCCGDLTPEKALRPVGQIRLGALPTLQDAGFVNPYPAVAGPAVSVLRRGRPVSFARGGDGQALIRWGWAEPENDFTWSLGIEAALEFSVAEAVNMIDLRFIPYRRPGKQPGLMSFVLNGKPQGTVDLGSYRMESHLLRLQRPLAAGAAALLELVLSHPRRPDMDGGDDKRPIGIALKSISVG